MKNLQSFSSQGVRPEQRKIWLVVCAPFVILLGFMILGLAVLYTILTRNPRHYLAPR